MSFIFEARDRTEQTAEISRNLSSNSSCEKNILNDFTFLVSSKCLLRFFKGQSDFSKEETFGVLPKLVWERCLMFPFDKLTILQSKSLSYINSSCITKHCEHPHSQQRGKCILIVRPRKHYSDAKDNVDWKSKSQSIYEFHLFMHDLKRTCMAIVLLIMLFCLFSFFLEGVCI